MPESTGRSAGTGRSYGTVGGMTWSSANIELVHAIADALIQAHGAGTTN